MWAVKEARSGNQRPGDWSRYGDVNRVAGADRLQNEPSLNLTASTPILIPK
jgi:hypothetical protein